MIFTLVFVGVSVCGAVQSSAVSVEVNVQDISPVEVMLCRGETSIDLQNFEQEITEALVAEGVARERIRFVDGASMTLGSTRDGLQQMIDNFDVNPDGLEPPRIVNGNLVGPGPDVFQADSMRSSMPALISKSTYRGPVWINAWSYCYCPSHGYAVIPRITMDNQGRVYGWMVFIGTIRNWTHTADHRVWECDPDFMTTVYPTLAADGNHHDYIQLLWIPGVPMDKIQRWRNHLLTADGYPDLRVAALSSEISRAHMGMGGNPLGAGRPGAWYCKNAGMTVEMTDEKIKVWSTGWEEPDQLVLEYDIPEERRLIEGNVGYALIDVNHGGLSGITFKLTTSTPLAESLRGGNWSAGSNPQTGYRFIVDVCDVAREDAGDTVLLSEAMQRLGISGVYYVGCGTTASRASLQAYVNANDGNGKVVLTTGNWLKKVAEYIEPIVNKRFDGDELYLLRGKEYNFTTREVS